MISCFSARYKLHKWFIHNGKASTADNIMFDKFDTYADFIASDFWKEQRNHFYKKNKKECYICKSRKNIDVHHITYQRMFIKPLLIFLCRTHHYKLHDIPFKFRSSIHLINRLIKDNFDYPKTKNEDYLIKKLGTIEYYRRLRLGEPATHSEIRA